MNLIHFIAVSVAFISQLSAILGIKPIIKWKLKHMAVYSVGVLSASLSLLALVIVDIHPYLIKGSISNFLPAFILLSLLGSFYLSLLGMKSSYRKGLGVREFIFWMTYGLILGLPFATDLYRVDYSESPFRIAFFVADVVWIVLIAIVILYTVFETLLINKNLFLRTSDENRWWARLHMAVLIVFAGSIVELVIGIFLLRIHTVLLIILPLIAFYTISILFLLINRPSFFAYHIVNPLRLIVSHDYSALVDMRSEHFITKQRHTSSLISMSVQSVIEIIRSEEKANTDKDFVRSVLEYGEWKVLFYQHGKNSLMLITTGYTDSLDVMCQYLLDEITSILPGFADRFGIEVISPIHLRKIRKKVITMFPTLLS